MTEFLELVSTSPLNKLTLCGAVVLSSPPFATLANFSSAILLRESTELKDGRVF